MKWIVLALLASFALSYAQEPDFPAGIYCTEHGLVFENGASTGDVHACECHPADDDPLCEGTPTRTMPRQCRRDCKENLCRCKVECTAKGHH